MARAAALLLFLAALLVFSGLALLAFETGRHRERDASAEHAIDVLRAELAEAHQAAEVEYWARQREHDLAKALARCGCQEAP